MTPAVTAIIPTQAGRNQEWLQQALGSLAGVPYLLLENDGELCQAWNTGLREAQTEWVLFFSDDDVALPEFVDWLLSQSLNADVVYPSVHVCDGNLDLQYSVPAAPFCPYRLRRENYITGIALARREAVLAAGGFRDLPVMEDWDLWLRMLDQGARFKPAPEAWFCYRKHDGGRNRVAEADLDVARAQVAPEPPPVKATFYNQGTPATTYLRCQLPARHLPAVVMPDGAWGLDENGMLGHDGQAAVFQFPGDKVRAVATQVLKETGHRVLVEVDDNYLIHPGRDWLKSSGWAATSGEESPHSVSGHRWIVDHADGVIVTTEQLARSYRKTGKPVFVCPNAVDPADWPEPEKPDDGILRIGWVASESHMPDIPLVTRAMEWASAQPDVQVFTVGLDPKWKFPYGHLPWLHDLDAYRDCFRYFDIGVAPIKATPQALGRSDVKALEIAMGASCPVLSDVAPYSEWVDGVNCLKADGPAGFLKAIKTLVGNRPLVSELAAAARDYTLRERTIGAQIHKWEEALAG